VSTKRFQTPVFLPAQAAADTEATITKWNIAEGDSFTKGQILAEIESAKTSFDFEAPCSGTIVKLRVVEGDTVSFDVPVMDIETDDSSMRSELPEAALAKEAAPATSASAGASRPSGGQFPSRVCILGIGGYLPERVVTNQELLKEFPNLTDDYMFGVTGIRERRWAKEGEKPSEMAYKASLAALQRSNIEARDLGAIVLATETPDVAMPATACILQDMLGARGIPAFDLNAACSGWLYALSVARGMIISGVADNILVVSTELQSLVIDKTDMETCFLLGDGAGAAILSGSRDGHAIKNVILKAESKGLHMIKRAVPGYKIPMGVENLNPWIRMEGHALFRFATEGFSTIIRDVTSLSGWKPEEVQWVIPHQANRRILKAAAQKSGISFDRFYINIERLGNTGSASIANALVDLEKDLHKGDKMVLCSVGAGITVGAVSVEW
jgi:3-oxoacyl-[acyl-carrier-protein] synthase III